GAAAPERGAARGGTRDRAHRRSGGRHGRGGARRGPPHHLQHPQGPGGSTPLRRRTHLPDGAGPSTRGEAPLAAGRPSGRAVNQAVTDTRGGRPLGPPSGLRSARPAQRRYPQSAGRGRGGCGTGRRGNRGAVGVDRGSLSARCGPRHASTTSTSAPPSLAPGMAAGGGGGSPTAGDGPRGGPTPTRGTLTRGSVRSPCRASLQIQRVEHQGQVV